jgi:hypothetical protein
LWAFISAKSGRAAQRDIEDVWTAIALHTTPGMPAYAPHDRARCRRRRGGRARYRLSSRTSNASMRAHHPREENFKESIIDHFAQGIIKKRLLSSAT